MNIRKRIFLYAIKTIVISIMCALCIIYFDNYIFLLIWLVYLLYVEIIIINIRCPKCGKQVTGMKFFGIPKKCTNCGYNFTENNSK